MEMTFVIEDGKEYRITNHIGGPDWLQNIQYTSWITWRLVNKEQLHREKGPAYLSNDGYKLWCWNNNTHRINGPAIIQPNNSKEWWIDGKEVSEQTHAKIRTILALRLDKI